MKRIDISFPPRSSTDREYFELKIFESFFHSKEPNFEKNPHFQVIYTIQSVLVQKIMVEVMSKLHKLCVQIYFVTLIKYVDFANEQIIRKYHELFVECTNAHKK